MAVMLPSRCQNHHPHLVMHPYQHHRQSLQLQKGLENVYIRLYTGILNIRKVINPQSKKLQEGDSNQQCLIFARVKAADLAKIDDVRSSIGKHALRGCRSADNQVHALRETRNGPQESGHRFLSDSNEMCS